MQQILNYIAGGTVPAQSGSWLDNRDPSTGQVFSLIADSDEADVDLAQARKGRAELGSEVELAPNRKPYYDDETLEGKRLERVQLFGVLLLALIVVILPLYWVF